MTDAELLAHSAEHLKYEIDMLYKTGFRLVTDPAFDSDDVGRNAHIESFCLHARVIATFLHPEEAKQFATDVEAERYVTDKAAWEEARGAISPSLKTVITRTAKEIAHLTTERRRPGEPPRPWNPMTILRAVELPLKEFLAHADAKRLDTAARTVIQTHLAAPKHAPSELTTSAAFVTGGVPTGRIAHRTDVSTP